MSQDHHVVFDGAYYSLPTRWIGKQVDIRGTERLIQIFHQGELIKSHQPAKKGTFQTDLKDYPERQRIYLLQTADVCREKTHVAQAIGHQACRMGYKVLFTKASHLFRHLAVARADGSWDEKIREYGKVDLLIIDDFGLKNLTTQQADDIYEVVSERHLKGGMFFTSNRNVDDWLELFPDPIFANSVLDRFAHNAHQITMEGESYRKKKRPIEMTT